MKKGSAAGRFEQSFVFHMIRDFFLLLLAVAAVEMAIRYAVLLYEFRTEALARKGLVDALRERLVTVEHRAGLSGEVHALDIGSLPMTLEETFYRVAMEALNNALRHAHGDRVDVILMEESGDLVMTIVDNGVGFNRETSAAAGGMGLEGMQKRMGKVGGALTLSSSSGGTWVTARASLKQ